MFTGIPNADSASSVTSVGTRPLDCPALDAATLSYLAREAMPAWLGLPGECKGVQFSSWWSGSVHWIPGQRGVFTELNYCACRRVPKGPLLTLDPVLGARGEGASTRAGETDCCTCTGGASIVSVPFWDWGLPWRRCDAVASAWAKK